MPATLDPLPMHPMPSPKQPLTGVTVLLVEDSRSASETVRLLSVRSGARIRRADSVRAAWRHLSVYQPSAVIVDLGLPDGSGLDLIHELVHANNRIPAILGTSGNDQFRARVLDVGADGFLLKPIENLNLFQAELLSALPEENRFKTLRVVADDVVAPDATAMQDDYAHVLELLEDQPDPHTMNYAAQFVQSVAYSTHDKELEKVAASMAGERKGALTHLTDMLRARLEQAPII